MALSAVGRVLAVLLVVTAFACRDGDAATNCSDAEAKFKNCKDGMIFPLWMPFRELPLGQRITRAVIYALVIIYIFVGISIVADRFMSSIEMITSKERQVVVERKDGRVYRVTVKIWNETVSNLSLMALGSSAPEILLAIIEICGHNFEAGELGPNTIVGSAAFNLFMIIAICVSTIPSPEVRRQKHLNVFFVTATWSLFAYIWLYLILAKISPGVVEVWEGLLTLSFFPLTVLTAYIADVKMIQNKLMAKLSKRYRDKKALRHELRFIGEDGLLDGKPVELKPISNGVHHINVEDCSLEDEQKKSLDDFEDPPLDYDDVIQDALCQPTPDIIFDAAQTDNAEKSRESTGKFPIKKGLEKRTPNEMEILVENEEETSAHVCRVFLNPTYYTVEKNVGLCNIVVNREGGSANLTVLIDYQTEDASINGGPHYIAKTGTLAFHMDTKQQRVPIEIIPNDTTLREDTEFYFHLTNLRVQTDDAVPSTDLVLLAEEATAVVTILASAESLTHSSSCRRLPADGTTARDRYDSWISARDWKEIGELPLRAPMQHSDGEQKHEGKQRLVSDTPQSVRDQFGPWVNAPVGKQVESQSANTLRVPGTPRSARELHEHSNGSNRDAGKMSLPNNLLVPGTPKSFRGRMNSWFSAHPDDDDDNDSSSSEGALSRRLTFVSAAELPMIGDDADGVRGPTDAASADGEPLPRPSSAADKANLVHTKIVLNDKKDFGNVVDKFLKFKTPGTSLWREQFVEALTIGGGADDDEEEKSSGDSVAEKGDNDEKASNNSDAGIPSHLEYAFHYVALPWKLIFACVPPTDYWGGWACFIVSIMGIGVLTAMVGDLAGHFGCWVGLKDAVTAIVFVALGTSVPDTFTSKLAAVQDKYADASIGNVTGSNGVNVFLGIGIAWTIAAVYHNLNDRDFEVEAGTLAFSVTVFCLEALVAIAVLLLRRHRLIGGELGGPLPAKIATSLFLVSLWLLYISLATLESYCVIEGF